MKYIQIMCLILFSLLALQISPVHAQQVSVDLRLFSSDARIFYVGDLDPTGVGNAPDYYILELDNTGAQIEAKIIFDLIKDGISLVYGESNIFTLPTGNFVFTNNQLNTGIGMFPPPPTDNFIKLEILIVDFDLIEGLQNAITKTGKLIAGRYSFVIRLEVYSNGIPTGVIIDDINPQNNILTISNPTTLEPIYPGVRVNQFDLPEIPTAFPYFIWQSDADRFNLFVYRAYEDESIQDVLSREWVLRLENYPNQIFQYPSDSEPLFFDEETAGGEMGGSVGAIRLLEPGNTYYWYVEALIPTASAEDAILKSDVYQFKISDKVGTEMDSDLILAYLRQILGDRYDEVMQNLLGYDPTGTILLNGQEVQIDELVKLIGKLNRGEVDIQDLSVTQ